MAEDYTTLIGQQAQEVQRTGQRRQAQIREARREQARYAERLDQWAQVAPQADPSIIASLATGGVNPYSEEGRTIQEELRAQAAQAAQFNPQKKKGWRDRVSGAIGTVTRPLFATFSAPWEMLTDQQVANVSNIASRVDSKRIEGGETSTIEWLARINPSNMFQNLGDTTIAQIVKGKDAGEGFFASGEAAQERSKTAIGRGRVVSRVFSEEELKKFQVELGSLKEGEDYRRAEGGIQLLLPSTIGRATASMIGQSDETFIAAKGGQSFEILGRKTGLGGLNPLGTGWYDFLSGSIDIAGAIATDPTTYVAPIKAFKASGEGLQAGSRAMRLAKLSGASGERLDDLERAYVAAAKLELGKGKFATLADQVDSAGKAWWMSDKGGVKLAEKLADISSPYQIYKLSKGQWSFDLAEQMAKTDNVEDILKLGLDYMENGENMARWSQKVRQSRLSQVRQSLRRDEPMQIGRSKRLSTFAGRIGRSAMDPNNPEDYVDKMARHLEFFRVSEQDKNRLMDEVVRAFADPSEGGRKNRIERVESELFFGTDGILGRNLFKKFSNGEEYIKLISDGKALRKSGLAQEADRVFAEAEKMLSASPELQKAKKVWEEFKKSTRDQAKSNKFQNKAAAHVNAKFRAEAPAAGELPELRKELDRKTRLYSRLDARQRKSAMSADLAAGEMPGIKVSDALKRAEKRPELAELIDRKATKNLSTSGRGRTIKEVADEYAAKRAAAEAKVSEVTSRLDAHRAAAKDLLGELERDISDAASRATRLREEATAFRDEASMFAVNVAEGGTYREAIAAAEESIVQKTLQLKDMRQNKIAGRTALSKEISDLKKEVKRLKAEAKAGGGLDFARGRTVADRAEQDMEAYRSVKGERVEARAVRDKKKAKAREKEQRLLDARRKAEEQLAEAKRIEREYLSSKVDDGYGQLAERVKQQAEEDLKYYKNRLEAKRRAEEAMTALGPNHVEDLRDRVTFLPSSEDIKKVERLFESQATRLISTPGRAVLSGISTLTDIMKSLQILRPAYITRQVFLDSLLRSHLIGGPSFWTHPVNFISMIALEDDSNALIRLANKMAPEATKARLFTDVTGENLIGADKGVTKFVQRAEETNRDVVERWRADLFAQELNAKIIRNGLDDPSLTRYKRVLVGPGDEAYRSAVSDEIKKIVNDPIQSAYLRGNFDTKDFDRLVDLGVIDKKKASDFKKQWLERKKTGQVMATREDVLRELEPGGWLYDYARQWDYSARPKLTRAQQENWVDTLFKSADDLLGEDPILRGKIANLWLDSPQKYYQLDDIVNDAWSKKAFKSEVSTMVEDGQMAEESKNVFARANDKLFDWLVDAPEARLAKSPVYRQQYWEYVTENARYLSVKDRKKVLAQAKKNRMPDKMLARLEQSVGRAEPKNPASLDAINGLGKRSGIEKVRNNFYEWHRMGRYDQALKVVIPFAGAWKNNIQFYSKAFAKNPEKVYQFANAYEEAEKSPFMERDARTGELMLVIPGSASWNEMVAGVPLPSRIRASSVNLITTGVMPGGAPLLQVSAAKIAEDNPDLEWLKRYLAPYGDPSAEGGALGVFTPAWAERLATGIAGYNQDGIRFRSAVGDTMQYLASTGEYNTSTRVGQEELYNDSVTAAKRLIALGGLAAFVAPGAPDFVAAIEANGDLLEAEPIIRGMRETRDKLMEQGFTFDDADFIVRRNVIEMYGEDVFPALKARNRRTGGALPTREQADWTYENMDIRTTAPDFFGYFGPVGGTEDFEYYDKITSAQPLTLEERFVGSQRDLINVKVREAEDYLTAQRPDGKLTTDDRRVIASYRRELQAQTPGTGKSTGWIDDVEKFQQLENAAQLSEQKGEQVGYLAGQYLAARDQLLGELLLEGHSTFDSQDAAPYRQVMYMLGEEFAAQDERFARLWADVLSEEMSGF